MVAAAAIAGAARQAIKWTSRVVVVVGEYLIIELRIRVAIELRIRVAPWSPNRDLMCCYYGNLWIRSQMVCGFSNDDPSHW